MGRGAGSRRAAAVALVPEGVERLARRALPRLAQAVTIPPACGRGGRPLLERYGKYVLIRPHEIDAAEHFFAKWGSQTVFVGRFLPVIRTFISFPAGVALMPLGRFIVYSAIGAFLWSIGLVYAGTVLGAHWVDIRHTLQPFDTLILVVVVVAVVLFVWWRLGMPGRPGRKPAGS